MAEKLSQGPRISYDLAKTGAGLTRGPFRGKGLFAAPWSDTFPSPGSTLDLDFANDRGWVRGVGQGKSMDAVTFTGASVRKYVDQDGIVQDAANGQPRFDWASTAQLPQNLITFSEAFDTAGWTKTNVTLVSGKTDPDGGTSAYEFTAAATNADIRKATSFSATGQEVCNSLYVRRVSGTGNVLLLNPSGGSFTTITPTSTWQRFSTSQSGRTGNINVGVRLATSGDVIEIAFAQAELGLTPTTYYAQGAYLSANTPLAANPTSNGLLIEEARANRILWCRDATQANWTKTNVTAAKDQTGIDGVANAASSLTATANDGTCIQTITLASGSRTGSVYLKRITGTGNVQVSLDGSTYSTVDLSASEWRRIVISGTVTNPTVGIKLAVSGDAVAMDYGQVEDGAFVTSPILTTTASVTRAVDLAEIAGSNFSFFTQQEETSIVEFLGQGATAGLLLNSANIGNLQILNTGVARHANGISNLDTAANYTAGNFGKAAVSGNRAKRVVALNGITSLVNPQPIRSTTTVANVRIGGTAVTIKRATMLPKAITESALEAITK
jgi:hypothetical protein